MRHSTLCRWGKDGLKISTSQLNPKQPHNRTSELLSNAQTTPGPVSLPPLHMETTSYLHVRVTLATIA